MSGARVFAVLVVDVRNAVVVAGVVFVVSVLGFENETCAADGRRDELLPTRRVGMRK